MRIEIEIPKEFEERFKSDKFKDTLHRLSADAHLIAGNYEQETAIMLIDAFENSKPAYNVDKVVEQVADEFICDGCSECTICFELDRKHECGTYRALEKIIKQGGVDHAEPEPKPESQKPEPAWKQAFLRTFLGGR